ncbi:MAG: NADH-quinone oxidoreductase subunit NuoH [Chloracidobacterium sp.]|nr:NADH-quinone oxidoreductase subunit NuoH [Chloracidobacterium sp.]MDW8216617.1 NADH-quinone oxidoreductase subunit NuoH [Acidobacteriota bacterium]
MPSFELLLEWSVKIAVGFIILMTTVAYLSLIERRLLAFIQMRYGPNRVGPFGLFQPIADGLKFVFKEDLIPLDADKFLYVMAPALSFVPALMIFVLIPVGGEVTLPFLDRPIALYVTSVNVGVLAVLAMTGMGVYGIVMAGYASNNKYSLLGGLRSSAQLVSYELAMSLSIIGVLIQAGSLDLVTIVERQGGAWGFGWHVFWFQPIGFFVFLISMIAETNRAPFDLPEAESELVAGFHTEYSSMKFAMFFIAEYANMVTAAAMATTLFLGGWQGPGVARWPWLGPVYFVLKVAFFLFLYVWLRASSPRLRYDQLMDFGWKFLLPLALANVVLSATLALWF